MRNQTARKHIVCPLGAHIGEYMRQPGKPGADKIPPPAEDPLKLRQAARQHLKSKYRICFHRPGRNPRHLSLPVRLSVGFEPGRLQINRCRDAGGNRLEQVPCLDPGQSGLAALRYPADER